MPSLRCTAAASMRWGVAPRRPRRARALTPPSKADAKIAQAVGDARAIFTDLVADEPQLRWGSYANSIEELA